MGIDMLVGFIKANRADLILRATAKANRRLGPIRTEHVPSAGATWFLDELVSALRCAPSARAGAVERSAAAYGAALWDRGCTMAQVVHDYGDIRQAITELAAETDAPITSDEFRLLNGCVDNATAEAVTAYARLQDHATTASETERSGVFAHELRN